MGTVDNGHGHRPHLGAGDPLEHSDFSPEDAPEVILDLCAACDRFVQSKYGVPLDFTGDTLPLIDQYVRDARAELAVKPAALDLVSHAIGGYLGEVMRRTFGAEWFVEGEASQYRLYFTRVKLSTNPLGIARAALRDGEEEEYPSAFVVDPEYRGFVEEQLKQAAPVPEDEFYLPSTRFDTCSVIVELLHAKMEADGKERRRLSRVDY